MSAVDNSVVICEAWDLADPKNSCCITYFQRTDGSIAILKFYSGPAPFVFFGATPETMQETYCVSKHEADMRWPDRDD